METKSISIVDKAFLLAFKKFNHNLNAVCKRLIELYGTDEISIDIFKSGSRDKKLNQKLLKHNESLQELRILTNG